MKSLKNIKHILVNQVQSQCSDLKKTNAKELGEVIDMIKDLEEAMYYCAIIEAMEESQEEKKNNTYSNINYYMENPEHEHIKQYVPYMEYAPYMMRDDKWRTDHLDNEGRSNNSRRMYMEGKAKHQSDIQSMKDLETYTKDLADEVVEMIKESTPEEKQVLSSKLQTLASKVNK